MWTIYHGHTLPTLCAPIHVPHTSLIRGRDMVRAAWAHVKMLAFRRKVMVMTVKC